MGYENRLYVVSKYKTKGFDEEVKDFFACEVIAIFNLCGIDYEIRDKIDAFPDTDCFIWVNDKPVVKDCYGQMLKMIPLNDALKIFTYASAISDYRRYEACASLLRGFKESDWGDLYVLRYGY